MPARIVGFVLVPALVQLLIGLFVMVRNTGNGSFVGLAAMLFGLMGIPITATLNYVVSTWWAKTRLQRHIAFTLVLTSIYPGLLIALWVLVS